MLPWYGLWFCSFLPYHHSFKTSGLHFNIFKKSMKYLLHTFTKELSQMHTFQKIFFYKNKWSTRHQQHNISSKAIILQSLIKYYLISKNKLIRIVYLVFMYYIKGAFYHDNLQSAILELVSSRQTVLKHYLYSICR